MALRRISDLPQPEPRRGSARQQRRHGAEEPTTASSSLFPDSYFTDSADSPADEKPSRKRRVKIEELPHEEQVEKAKGIILNALSMSAKTRTQLAEKLASKEVPDAAAEEALDRLTEVGLIDDAAFANAWVLSRHRGRGLSASAIKRELKQKGIDAELAETALEQITSDEEWDRAVELVTRKAPSTARLDRQARVRRLAGMLARKGYSGGTAFAVVKHVLDQEGHDSETYLGSGQD